jgi:YVTN family beta-propeller protein
MHSRHAYLLFLALASILPASLLLLSSHAQTERSTIRPAAGGTRGPCAIAFSADGSRAYVAERLGGTVAVLEAGTGELIVRVDSGGKEPTGLALSQDGGTLIVANSFSDTLGIIDTARNELRAHVPLRGGPWSVVSWGGKAYVSLSRLDRVAVIDSATGKEEAVVPVGHRPRALALTPDGRALLCANMREGSLSIVSTGTREEISRLALGAVNLRDVAVSPDGTRAYVTGQTPHNDQPTADAEAMWSNVVVVARLDGRPAVERSIALDGPAGGAADPTGIAVTKEAAYVTLAGAHKVARLSPASGAASQRIPAEANPVELSVRPGGEVWCANALGNSLTVLSPNGEPLRTVRLDPPARPDIRVRGRHLFTSAHITKAGKFTCNTCHPDGGSEGLVWKFAHTKDGLDLRNSRDLRGVVLMTGPYGWTGRENDLEEFIEDEIHGLLQGPGFRHGDLHAYWDLVNQMELPPNPYRQPDGSFTESAKRGKALFTAAGGCSTCHTGPQSGGTKRLEWVGTTRAGLKLDVPHLQGAYDSAPYFHDGRAATLEDVFLKHNEAKKHGNAHQLAERQLLDVLEYVREL